MPATLAVDGTECQEPQRRHWTDPGQADRDDFLGPFQPQPDPPDGRSGAGGSKRRNGRPDWAVDDPPIARPPRIQRSHPRAVFAQLVAAALGRSRLQPSPMATAYLIELLDERVRQGATDPEEPTSLAEALLEAQLDRGTARIRRMRSLGDRALFVSGFFGDSLTRSVVDIDYYCQIGGSAYGDVAVRLRDRGAGGSWTRLYSELSQRFADFAEVLSEVGDRARPPQPENLLRLFERYLRTGSERDRERLIRSGHLPPDRSRTQWWQ